MTPEILPPDPHIEVLPDPVRRWLPATQAQRDALDSDADILLLGGAAGSLKTSTMLVDLIQERDWPKMRSYFFRRTYKELEGGDSAIDQSLQLFPQTGATYNASSHTWTWPSGAQFFFRHCQHKKDVYQYQGHAISAGAIDESTHWEEAEARYLLSRNRSTDPNMKTRWRLGTNPGNVGNDWHMRLFFPDVRGYPQEIVGVCPHCTPQVAPRQGILRWDARWPSDGKELSDKELGTEISVSYILSSIRDHALYKAEYIAKLKHQTENVAKALLEGCWKTFEGQYFNIWDYERMTFENTEVANIWYLPRWVGCDYGFSISAPAAHLAAQTLPSIDHPYGQVLILDEIGGHDTRDKTSEGFAKAIADKWVTQEDSQGRKSMAERRWQPWYLSPDAFADRGGQFTLAGQMNKVLDPYGLYFQKARDDRAGGWMKMYNALRDGHLVISKKCKKTITAIQSRICDPDKENDIKKVGGDELDDFADSCLVGGTLVTTCRGLVPIEQVTTCDSVWTRSGWRRVLRSWMTNPDAELLTVEFANGLHLTGTGNHPVWVEGCEFIRLDTLRYGYNVLCNAKHARFPKQSSSAASPSEDTQTAPDFTSATITGPAGQIARAELVRFIRKCGKRLTALFLRVTTSTTRMKTPSTMISGTSSFSLEPSIAEITCSSYTEKTLDTGTCTLPISDRLHRPGTDLQRAGSGTDRTLSGARLNATQSDVPGAELTTKELLPQDFAATLARARGAAPKVWTKLSERVCSVMSRLRLIASSRMNVALTPVVGVSTGGRGAVYNLEVEDQPEYFANGILVHNCRYTYYSWATAQEATVPARERVSQEMQQAWNRDPTAAMVRYPDLMKQVRDEGKPTVYGGSARARMRRLP